jgi:hypothetical protein
VPRPPPLPPRTAALSPAWLCQHDRPAVCLPLPPTLWRTPDVGGGERGWAARCCDGCSGGGEGVAARCCDGCSGRRERGGRPAAATDVGGGERGPARCFDGCGGRRERGGVSPLLRQMLGEERGGCDSLLRRMWGCGRRARGGVGPLLRRMWGEANLRMRAQSQKRTYPHRSPVLSAPQPRPRSIRLPCPGLPALQHRPRPDRLPAPQPRPRPVRLPGPGLKAPQHRPCPA